MQTACKWCGGDFGAKRRDARYCSTACRTAASRSARGVTAKREVLPEGQKRCPRCREVKHLDDFHQLNGARQRHHAYCKACVRRDQRARNRVARGLPADHTGSIRGPIPHPEGSTYTHTRSGYVFEKRTGHARADRNGWVAQHLLVAEEKYGIAITDAFTVHHRNRNRGDNAPSNLELRVGPHGKGGDVIDTLLTVPEMRDRAVDVLRAQGYTITGDAAHRAQS